MENFYDWQTITMTQEDDNSVNDRQQPASYKLGLAPIRASAGEIDRAMSVLNQITTSSDPAGEVARNLDQIDRLLPALLEVNIRQAQEDGRLDLAVALQDIKTQIEEQRSIKESSDSTHGHEVEQQHALLLTPDSLPTRRMAVIEAALKRGGWKISRSEIETGDQAIQPDVVIACNPHLEASILKQMAACSAKGIPIVVDLGDDFEHLPVRHRSYEKLGLGTHANARAFTSALLLADHITVPCHGLANALCATQATVSIIPDGWDGNNPLWTKSFPRRATLNIGWMGNPGQAEDLFALRRIIIRALREFSETQLVIVGDSQAFQLFDSLPQNRKLFLPSVSPEEYPYLFSQIDLLLVPMGNQPYFHSQSDQVLVEAGARSIPWIATPLPTVTSWKAGGVTANLPDEWHSYLRQLILDENLRRWMGETGHQQALSREAGQLKIQWQSLLDHIRFHGTTPPNDVSA
jgi:hypothetical protein